MKRLLSILITMCMTFLFVPSIVYAESYSSPETQELQNLISQALLNENSLLVLEKDYTITESLSVHDSSVSGSLTLDLNGHVIRMDANYAPQHQIIVVSNMKLILNDSRPEAEHTGAYAGLPAGGVITGTRGDGTIPGHYFAGGGITANYLVMNGGTIYDCRGSFGGAVSASVFEMNGGSIVNCHAKIREAQSLSLTLLSQSLLLMVVRLKTALHRILKTAVFIWMVMRQCLLQEM